MTASKPDATRKKVEKRVVKAAMRLTKGSGFIYRGLVCNGAIVNVITNRSAADELEKACAALTQLEAK